MIHNEDLSCEKVLSLLDAYVSSELLVETTVEILAHLDRCQSCSSVLDSKIRLRVMVQATVQRQPVPQDLLDGVRTVLSRPASHGTYSRWAVAAAVLLVLLTGGGTVWYFAPGPDEVSRVLQIGLEAHRQCSQEPGLDYLGWEYSGLVDVVGAEMPSNYGIAAAHQCVLKGRTFVHLVFESGNTRASFVVTEKENERFTASDKNRPFDADGVPVYFNTIDKHEVAGFETRRHLAFVVSDLDRDANLQLSRSIAVLYAPSVRSTLQEVSNAH